MRSLEARVFLPTEQTAYRMYYRISIFYPGGSCVLEHGKTVATLGVTDNYFGTRCIGKKYGFRGAKSKKYIINNINQARWCCSFINYTCSPHGSCPMVYRAHPPPEILVGSIAQSRRGYVWFFFSQRPLRNIRLFVRNFVSILADREAQTRDPQ